MNKLLNSKKLFLCVSFILSNNGPSLCWLVSYWGFCQYRRTYQIFVDKWLNILQHRIYYSRSVQLSLHLNSEKNECWVVYIWFFKSVRPVLEEINIISRYDWVNFNCWNIMYAAEVVILVWWRGREFDEITSYISFLFFFAIYFVAVWIMYSPFLVPRFGFCHVNLSKVDHLIVEFKIFQLC